MKKIFFFPPPPPGGLYPVYFLISSLYAEKFGVSLSLYTNTPPPCLVPLRFKIKFVIIFYEKLSFKSICKS